MGTTTSQPAGNMVYALLAVEGEFWAAVGRELVVWGPTGGDETVAAAVSPASPPHL